MPFNKLRNKVQLRKITSLLQRVFPTSRFTAFGHKMSWRVTYMFHCKHLRNLYDIQDSKQCLRETKIMSLRNDGGFGKRLVLQTLCLLNHHHLFVT